MLYIYKALFHFSVSASRPTQQLRDLPPIKGFARSWRMQLSQLNLPSTLLLLLCRLKTFTTVPCARLGLRPRTPLVSMLCLIFKRRVDILWGHMTIKYTNLYMSIQFTSCSPRPWGTSITWPLSPRCCAGRSSSGSRYSFDQYIRTYTVVPNSSNVPEVFWICRNQPCDKALGLELHPPSELVLLHLRDPLGDILAPVVTAILATLRHIWPLAFL